MKYICPLIVVEDMARSRDFYEMLLGQKVKADFGENVTYEGDFAIHIRSHYADLIGGKEIAFGGNNMELYFEQDGLEALSDKLLEAGVEFVHPLREQPWRQHVLRIYDPDGHILEIGESFEHLCKRLHIEGIGLEEISRITYLPVEIVEKHISEHSP